MSKEPQNYPKPTMLLSKPALLAAWKASKDHTKKAGSPGVDGVTARSFGANLDVNLARLAKDIKDGSFEFSPLRPRLVPKPNSTKFRLICVPTVRDRLVQRRIVKYLYDNKKFPIYNSSSFGFIPEEGLKKALNKVKDYRETYDFVFETDIIGFFDQVNRNDLSKLVRKSLGSHSLVPLILKALKCEIKKSNDDDEKKFLDLGVSRSHGIRQGMPLSPILSNLVLSEFDAFIEKRMKIPMVRYADDIVIFAKTKKQAVEWGNVLKEKLAEIGHQIPEFGDNSKTQIVSKFTPLSFLGREIVFSEREGRFVQRISDRQIEKIMAKLTEDAKIDTLIKNRISFPEFSRSLTLSVSSYISSYGDAYNIQHFENEMRYHAKNVIREIYKSIFGKKSLNNINQKHEIFLGIDKLDLTYTETDFIY